ncbi:MAG: LysM peptidoglycan-binding domain-containing protein, partial [Flavobacterium sp.]
MSKNILNTFFSGLNILMVMLLFTSSLLSQNHIKHKVSKGETITQISVKYKVTPYDIYKLNPDAQNGLNENSILLIPINEKLVQNGFVKHDILEGDTLFKIANRYQLKVEDLLKHNPGLSPETLQIGQVVLIPLQQTTNETKSTTVSKQEKYYHVVEPKETKYGIAQKYNISIAQLEEWNPEIKESLPVGFNLKITKTVSQNNDIITTKPQSKNDTTKVYRVASKETLFSISNRFDITIDELRALNPELVNGLQMGMELKVPHKTNLIQPLKPTVEKPVKNLENYLNLRKEKEIVILLPFNLSKIKSDTTLTTQQRLKRDNFLNLTLDIYAGALMALDSARKMNYPLKVKILDSKETRSGSVVQSLINSQQFSNASAVIGPFYPQNVTLVAKALSDKNIPVISPLRESTTSENNLFESMPSQEAMKSELIRYLKSKNGNLIAYIDPRKGTTRKFIQDEFPEIYQMAHFEKVGFVYDSLAPRLSKNRKNYFLLESATTGVILNSLRHINQAKSHGYEVSLVLLEMNSTYEVDEVFRRIVSLKPIFPSLTNAQDTNENLNFANAFKKRYNAFPNQYVMRGFDVTFDVIQRVLHEDGFYATIDQYATEQLDYKF